MCKVVGKQGFTLSLLDISSSPYAILCQKGNKQVEIITCFNTGMNNNSNVSHDVCPLSVH